MSFSAVRTHYFHANASAIGGYIVKPLVKNIPVQSPTSLAPAGGRDQATTANFQFDPFEKIMSARLTRSGVEGTYPNDKPFTRAMALVEDLDVLGGFIHADVLFAYISTEHPGQDPDVPIVNLGETAINGLRVDKASLTVTLNTKLLDNGGGKPLTQPHLREAALWKWAKKDFDPDKRFLQCSLVKEIKIEGDQRGVRKIEPNIIEIDNVGRMHLAELLVSGTSYELIMMRLELGCPVVGSASMSATKVNGTGGP
jgi:hypothetical protein